MKIVLAFAVLIAVAAAAPPKKAGDRGQSQTQGEGMPLPPPTGAKKPAKPVKAQNSQEGKPSGQTQDAQTSEGKPNAPPPLPPKKPQPMKEQNTQGGKPNSQAPLDASVQPKEPMKGQDGKPNGQTQMRGQSQAQGQEGKPNGPPPSMGGKRPAEKTQGGKPKPEPQPQPQPQPQQQQQPQPQPQPQPQQDLQNPLGQGEEAMEDEPVDLDIEARDAESDAAPVVGSDPEILPAPIAPKPEEAKPPKKKHTRPGQENKPRPPFTAEQLAAFEAFFKNTNFKRGPNGKLTAHIPPQNEDPVKRPQRPNRRPVATGDAKPSENQMNILPFNPEDKPAPASGAQTRSLTEEQYELLNQNVQVNHLEDGSTEIVFPQWA